MANGDIHNRTERIRKTVETIKNCDHIQDHNRETLLDFKAYLEAEDLSKDRIARYLYNWYQLLEHVDWPLDEPEKDDLIELVGKINQDEIRDRELSPHTKHEYKKAIRKFYCHYLESKKNGDFDGEQLCDFFTLTVNTTPVDPDRLPTPETVKRLVKNADRTRDKALIMTLWSSAGRIGEVLGLQWKDVKFSEDIAKVRFRDTKTGGSRTVPLREGYLYLKELQEADERSSEPDAYVFRSLTTDKQMSHNAACNIIARAREGTEIPDRIKTNPHAFRKGRATYLASQGMNQAQLCQFGGWAQGSSHVAKYIRMAESDVEQGIRQISGIKDKQEEEQPDLNPVKCHECRTLNKFEAETCRQCDETLKTSDLFTEMQIQETKEKLKTKMIEEDIGTSEEEIKEAAEELLGLN